MLCSRVSQRCAASTHASRAARTSAARDALSASLHPRTAPTSQVRGWPSPPNTPFSSTHPYTLSYPRTPTHRTRSERQARTRTRRTPLCAHTRVHTRKLRRRTRTRAPPSSHTQRPHDADSRMLRTPRHPQRSAQSAAHSAQRRPQHTPASAMLTRASNGRPRAARTPAGQRRGRRATRRRGRRRTHRKKPACGGAQCVGRQQGRNSTRRKAVTRTTPHHRPQRRERTMAPTPQGEGRHTGKRCVALALHM